MFEQTNVVLLNCQNLDSERNIYQEYLDKYRNISAIEHREYTRLYASWNDGIRRTDSPYITNSNADDQLHPECWERLVAALDANQDYDVAMSDVYVTDQSGLLWPAWHWYGDITILYPGGTAGPAPVWRRSLHERFGMFQELRVISDALAWHEWHSNGVKFLHVKEPLVLYYQANRRNLETRLDPDTGQLLRDLDEREFYGIK